MPQFIELLSVAEETKRKLRTLGVDTPESLLGMMQASPEAFEQFAGAQKTQALRSELRRLIPKDRLSLVQSAPQAFTLGAELGAPPTPIDAPFDTRRRDRLHAELTMLRANPEHRNRDRVRELEQELNAMMEGNQT